MHPSAVTSPVAPYAGRDNVLQSIAAAILPRHQMFGSAFEMLGQSWLETVIKSELLRILLPHGELAIEAAAILGHEGLPT